MLQTRNPKTLKRTYSQLHYVFIIPFICIQQKHSRVCKQKKGRYSLQGPYTRAYSSYFNIMHATMVQNMAYFHDQNMADDPNCITVHILSAENKHHLLKAVRSPSSLSSRYEHTKPLIIKIPSKLLTSFHPIHSMLQKGNLFVKEKSS